jgi:hypothetical protein
MSVHMLWPIARLRDGLTQRILLRRGLWVVGLVTLAAVALNPAAMIGGRMLTAAATAAQQTADMIAQRSPGLRTRAEMSKGKPRLALDRVSRALPRVRDARPAAPAAAAAPAPVAAAVLPGVSPPVAAPAIFVPGAPVGGAAFVDSGPGFGLLPPPPGFGVGGGGGGFVVAPPGTITPETPPAALPPPIPEPATWMTVILGFAAMGGAIRRRARLASAHA